MVGLLENVDMKMTMDFKKAGDHIYLVGQSNNDINSSEYLHKIHGIEFSPAPHFDLEEEFALHRVIEGLISLQLISSAHDVSEGGLFITLVESGFNRNLGFNITSNKAFRKDAWLFGEAQSRVIVSVGEKDRIVFEAYLAAAYFSFEKLGTVTDATISIDGENWETISEWKNKYDNAIGSYLAGHESEQAMIAL
jgi:phosphoribosylformylglycinamidine synthase